MDGIEKGGLLWNNLVVKKLVTVRGMEPCMIDPCVLRVIGEGKVVLILTVHIGDMAVAGTGVEVDKLLETFNTDFTTNDLGEPSFSQGVP